MEDEPSDPVTLRTTPSEGKDLKSNVSEGIQYNNEGEEEEESNQKTRRISDEDTKEISDKVMPKECK